MYASTHFKVLGTQRLGSRRPQPGVPLEQVVDKLEPLLCGIWDKRAEARGYHEGKLEIHGGCKLETLGPGVLIRHEARNLNNHERVKIVHVTNMT